MRVHNGCSRTLYHDGPATHRTHESQPGSCEVACHALSPSIFHLPTTAAIGPEWDLRCLHGYASLEKTHRAVCGLAPRAAGLGAR